MYSKVLNVKPTDNYKLILLFDNQEVREFDVEPYLELGIFKELKNLTVFNSVRISFDTVEWINNADFDPEFLYQKSIKLDNVNKNLFK
jgi:hypothetical protein